METRTRFKIQTNARFENKTLPSIAVSDEAPSIKEMLLRVQQGFPLNGPTIPLRYSEIPDNIEDIRSYLDPLKRPDRDLADMDELVQKVYDARKAYEDYTKKSDKKTVDEPDKEKDQGGKSALDEIS